MSDFIIAEAEEVGDVQHVPDHDVPLSAEQLSSFIDDTAEKDDSQPIVRRHSQTTAGWDNILYLRCLQPGIFGRSVTSWEYGGTRWIGGSWACDVTVGKGESPPEAPPMSRSVTGCAA